MDVKHGVSGKPVPNRTSVIKCLKGCYCYKTLPLPPLDLVLVSLGGEQVNMLEHRKWETLFKNCYREFCKTNVLSVHLFYLNECYPSRTLSIVLLTQNQFFYKLQSFPPTCSPFTTLAASEPFFLKLSAKSFWF